jgi:hypothetical protein
LRWQDRHYPGCEVQRYPATDFILAAEYNCSCGGREPVTMTIDPEHKKTLDVLEKLTQAGNLQESCPHDAEPDFCDACAVQREKALGEAKKEARARLRECGRRVSVG